LLNYASDVLDILNYVRTATKKCHVFVSKSRKLNAVFRSNCNVYCKMAPSGEPFRYFVLLIVRSALLPPAQPAVRQSVYPSVTFKLGLAHPNL